MKILAFKSLEEVNEFLAEQGLPPLPQEAVDAGVAQAAAQAGENVEDVVASFTLNLADANPDVSPESIMQAIFGQQETDIDEDEEVMPVSDFNDYVEFTSGQIARLTAERDEARALVELERQSHERCHEHMQLHIHQIRVQGYAESIAAGLFPGKPFETLTQDQQEVLMRQAHQSVENIDAIRAGLANGEQASPTRH